MKTPSTTYKQAVMADEAIANARSLLQELRNTPTRSGHYPFIDRANALVDLLADVQAQYADLVALIDELEDEGDLR